MNATAPKGIAELNRSAQAAIAHVLTSGPALTFAALIDGVMALGYRYRPYVANIVTKAFLAGSLEGWQRWMIDHAGLFFVWRVLLYAGTVWGWLWMRRRLHAREPEGGSQQRLLRVEIAAVLAVIALEASQFMQAK